MVLWEDALALERGAYRRFEEFGEPDQIIFGIGTPPTEIKEGSLALLYRGGDPL